MLSREEKNKELEKEIDHEKKINISKKIIKIFFIMITSFIILYVYASFIGTRFIQTKEYLIEDHFPKSFIGVKILHLSDLLYDSVNQNDLLSLKEEFQKINPDIVFFTGNIFNKEYQASQNDIQFLNDFFKSIPDKLGKYAVRGNTDTANFDLIMDNTNFTILDNELDTLYNGQNEFINIIGLNGQSENINKSDNYTITLINNYDLYNDYNISSNLVLAGNNLGGEIKLFNIPLLSTNKYMNEYYNENNTKIYISNGIGNIHGMRLFNHPSINVYRLYQ